MRLRSLAVCIALATAAHAANVRVWEGTQPLRATVEGPPSPNPPFDIFATTRFNYPYTLRDNLTGEEKEIAWRALFLENEYLKCSVLPDLGGHLYTCIDKISGQPMFYANPTIKKAQIGYRGAWSAFGIEFNFPVSHNWVSVSPVPYSIAQHPDGSASITVGNIDRPYGMQWTVELVLRPGSTVLEQRVTLYNRSDVRHRFYWWNNAGVRVWDDSRIEYPMRWTASHGFTEVDTWPVDSTGLDLSIIRNQTRGPVSLFVHGSREPFMGVYHPHTNTGIVHYADYSELPGKKFWSWGVDADGLDWRRALSDDNSAYVEVQAGLMRNQETYAFLQPRQSIRFTEYWMPARETGGISRANLAGVLHLARDNGRVTASFNPNFAIPAATIRLRDGAQVLSEFRGEIRPERTWSRSVPASAGKITFELSDAKGIALLRHTEGEYDWSPESEIHTGRQERIVPAGAIETGTDQELNGRLLDAYETYAAAPPSQAIQIAAGRLAVTLLRYADAVRWLVPAQAHATYDPEIAYYLGLAYNGLGQLRQARTQFEIALRMPEFRAAAALQLGELSVRESDRDNAIAYLREAAGDARAADDLALLADAAPPPPIHGDAERLLLAAADRMRLGLWREALDLLSRSYPEVPPEQREPGVPPPAQHPLVAYYRAFCLEKLRQPAAAQYAAASQLPTAYVFPQGAQTLAVLDAALAASPNDATAHYLLGNMRLQSGLTDQAVQEWQTAVRINPRIPVLHASLGRVQLRLLHQTQAAYDTFRAGLEIDASNPDLYEGISTTTGLLAHPPAERAAALARYPDPERMPVAQVYDLALSYAEAGAFDQARALFHNRFFSREEGGTNVRQVWIRVRALEGDWNAAHGQCAAALDILDHLREPATGLDFTRDGLDPFVNAAPNQSLAASVQQRCGRPVAPVPHRTAAPSATSSWNAYLAGVQELESGHPEKAAPLFEAALLFPDRNLAHHLARTALLQIKR